MNPAQQAAIWSRSHWSGAGQTRLTRPADRSEQRRMVGGGAMSVMSVMSVGWGINFLFQKEMSISGNRAAHQTISLRFLWSGTWFFLVTWLIKQLHDTDIQRYFYCLLEYWSLLTTVMQECMLACVQQNHTLASICILIWLCFGHQDGHWQHCELLNWHHSWAADFQDQIINI